MCLYLLQNVLLAAIYDAYKAEQLHASYLQLSLRPTLAPGSVETALVQVDGAEASLKWRLALGRSNILTRLPAKS